MSIYVSIEDQEGEQLAKVIDITKLQRHFKAITDSICLKFVTEIEDASFNQAQLEFVVRELDTLKKKELKKEEQEELEKLLSLTGKITNKKCTYLRFYADIE